MVTVAGFDYAATSLGELSTTISATTGRMADLASISNTLGGSLLDLAAKLTDAILNDVLPGLGSLVQIIIELPGKIVAAITPFVEALNPALLLTFNQQLANLNATVGTAFQNMFNNLAPVLDQVASLIQGAMDALQPVIDELVDMVGGYLIEVVRSAAAEMKAFLPIIQVLAALFKTVALAAELMMAVTRPIIELVGINLKLMLMPVIAILSVLNKILEPFIKLIDFFMTLISSTVDVFQELIVTFIEGLGIGDFFKMLTDAIKNFVLSIVQLTAWLLSWIPGGGKILDKMIEKLGGGPHAIAVPKDVHITGAEAITKDIATAAFIAGPGKATQEDLMKQMVDVLKQIRDGQKGEKKEKPAEEVGNFRDDHPQLAHA